ncbi:unnamed protein product, partial [Rotaria magnacalcarata]
SSSTGETNCKQQESRDHRHHHRRRRKSNSDSDQCDDNNNTLNSTSVLIIDEDLLHTAITRLSNENVSSNNDQHVFDRNYLRFINRR